MNKDSERVLRGIRNIANGVVKTDDETWAANLPEKFHKWDHAPLKWANFAQQKRNDS